MSHEEDGPPSVFIPRAPIPPTVPPSERDTQPPSELPAVNVVAHLVELSPKALAQVGEVVGRVVDAQLGPLRRDLEDLKEAHYVERRRRRDWERRAELRIAALERK